MVTCVQPGLGVWRQMVMYSTNRHQAASGQTTLKKNNCQYISSSPDIDNLRASNRY